MKHNEQKEVPGSLPSDKNQKPADHKNNGGCGDKHQERDRDKDKNDTGKKPEQKRDCDRCCNSLSEICQMTIYNDNCLYKHLSL